MNLRGSNTDNWFARLCDMWRLIEYEDVSRMLANIPKAPNAPTMIIESTPGGANKFYKALGEE